MTLWCVPAHHACGLQPVAPEANPHELFIAVLWNLKGTAMGDLLTSCIAASGVPFARGQCIWGGAAGFMDKSLCITWRAFRVFYSPSLL